MLNRLSQVARHVSSTPTIRSRASPRPLSSIMSSISQPSSSPRMIQTAACLIIGDEVLNGKVRANTLKELDTPTGFILEGKLIEVLDCRYEQFFLCKVLFFIRN